MEGAGQALVVRPMNGFIMARRSGVPKLEAQHWSNIRQNFDAIRSIGVTSARTNLWGGGLGGGGLGKQQHNALDKLM